MVDIKVNIDVEILDEKGLRPGLQRLGALIIKEIQKNIDDIELIKTTDFRQRWHHWVDAKNILRIEPGVDYAEKLEYGTYSYWESYGLGKFPEKPHPKKRDMTPTQKKAYPFGMQPFAPMRRVLFNKQLMDKLVKKAFT